MGYGRCDGGLGRGWEAGDGEWDSTVLREVVRWAGEGGICGLGWGIRGEAGMGGGGRGKQGSGDAWASVSVSVSVSVMGVDIGDM